RFSRDWSSDVCSSDLGESAQLLLRVRGAGRVRGRAEDQRLGAIGDRGGERVGAQAEAVALLGAQDLRGGAEEAHLVRIADPAGQIGRASCRETGKAQG